MECNECKKIAPILSNFQSLCPLSISTFIFSLLFSATVHYSFNFFFVSLCDLCIYRSAWS